MFLLVSVRHVGAHPGEHQYGVSIQISISLGKTFLRISRIGNIPLTWILARLFVYVFGFAVRCFVLPWGFWFCREVFCFCREVFGFAVTVVGHHKLRYIDWPIPVFLRFIRGYHEITEIYGTAMSGSEVVWWWATDWLSLLATLITKQVIRH